MIIFANDILPTQGRPTRLQQFENKGGRGRGRARGGGRGSKKPAQPGRGRGGRGRGRGGRTAAATGTTPVRKAPAEEPTTGPKPGKIRRSRVMNANEASPDPKNADCQEKEASEKASPKPKPSPKKACVKGPKGKAANGKTAKAKAQAKGKAKSKAKAAPKAKATATKKPKARPSPKKADPNSVHEAAGSTEKKKRKSASESGREKSFARRWRPDVMSTSRQWEAIRDCFNMYVREHITAPSKLEDTWLTKASIQLL